MSHPPILDKFDLNNDEFFHHCRVTVHSCTFAWLLDHLAGVKCTGGALYSSKVSGKVIKGHLKFSKSLKNLTLHAFWYGKYDRFDELKFLRIWDLMSKSQLRWEARNFNCRDVLKNVDFKPTVGDFEHPVYRKIGDLRPCGFSALLWQRSGPGYWISFGDFTE